MDHGNPRQTPQKLPRNKGLIRPLLMDKDGEYSL